MKLDWILNAKPKGWWWLLFSLVSHSRVDSASFSDAKRWAIAVPGVQKLSEWAIMRRERRNHRDFKKDLWAHWTYKIVRTKYIYLFECQIWVCVKTKGTTRFIHSSNHSLMVSTMNSASRAYKMPYTYHRLPGVFTVIYVINVVLFTISQKKASCCSNKVLLLIIGTFSTQSNEYSTTTTTLTTTPMNCRKIFKCSMLLLVYLIHSRSRSRSIQTTILRYKTFTDLLRFSFHCHSKMILKFAQWK